MTKKRCREKTLEHYKVTTLDGFGLSGKQFAVCACGALLFYLDETQKRELSHLRNIRYVDKNRYMSIDVKTRRNLELTVSYRENKRTGSLLWLLDKTETSMGARMLADWVDRPLQKASMINARLDGVEELFGAYLKRNNLCKALHGVYDIERLTSKIAYNNLTPKDCVSLKKSLQALPAVKQLISDCRSKILKDIFVGMDCLENVADLLEKAIIEDVPVVVKDADFIKEGFNAQLDELYDFAKNGGNKIAQLEEYERNRTGIRTLKLGYNKIFGYYFEVSNSFKNMVPENFIRKQTLTTGERFVSPELKELEEKMLTALEGKQRLQKKIFDDIRNNLLQYIPTLQQTAQCVAALDCLHSLATVAQTNDYCKPKINTKNTQLNITEGRHPIVESYLKRDNFITNDVYLDTEENRTMVITGPQHGRQKHLHAASCPDNALWRISAHLCPLFGSAEIPHCRQNFHPCGGKRRFGVQSKHLHGRNGGSCKHSQQRHNKQPSLFWTKWDVARPLLTDFPSLGPVMEYVSQKVRAKTLFATHYHELTELEGRVDGLKNYRITVKEFNGSVIFLHKIARGGANKSFGIEVAKLAGVPQQVCDRAKEIVSMLECSNISYNIENLQETMQNRKSNRTAQEVGVHLAGYRHKQTFADRGV